jgi:hypothetical protein
MSDATPKPFDFGNFVYPGPTETELATPYGDFEPQHGIPTITGTIEGTVIAPKVSPPDDAR